MAESVGVVGAADFGDQSQGAEVIALEQYRATYEKVCLPGK
jgi:hypothetical protein